MKLTIWVRGVVALLLSACVLYGLITAIFLISGSRSKLPSVPGLNTAEIAALDAAYADIVAGRDDALLQRFVHTDHASAKAELARIGPLIPSTPATSSRLVRWTGTLDGKKLTGVQEYEYPDRVVRVSTALVRPDAETPWRIGTLGVFAATNEELSANRFSLIGKPLGFVAAVLAAALIPLFILATAIVAIFRKNVRRRWLWLLFIIVGLTTLDLNTATGAFEWMFLSFRLFGASVTWSGSAFEPWVIGVSLPVGAILFWLTLHREPPTTVSASDGNPPSAAVA